MNNGNLLYRIIGYDDVWVCSIIILKKASGLNSLIDMLKNINLYIGGFLYVSSAVLNIWLLKILDYSVILPLTSLTYIWTMILSYFILKEKITVKKIAGVCLILVGAIIISSL